MHIKIFISYNVVVNTITSLIIINVSIQYTNANHDETMNLLLVNYNKISMLKHATCDTIIKLHIEYVTITVIYDT